MSERLGMNMSVKMETYRIQYISSLNGLKNVVDVVAANKLQARLEAFAVRPIKSIFVIGILERI